MAASVNIPIIAEDKSAPYMLASSSCRVAVLETEGEGGGGGLKEMK